MPKGNMFLLVTTYLTHSDSIKMTPSGGWTTQFASWKTTIVESGGEMAATSTDIFNSEREYEYQRVVNSLLSSSHTTVAVTRQLQPATRPSSARQLRRRQCEESGQDQRRYLTATSC